MKSTGIIRKVDDLGRIVIPREIRESLNIKRKDPIEIYVDGSSIILKKDTESCVFCGKEENLINFNGKAICQHCISQLSKKDRA